MEASDSVTEFFAIESLLDILEFWILDKLDFNSLLTARLISYPWNELISRKLLPKKAILNVRMDESESCRSFKHGLWKSNLMGRWEEINVFYDTHKKPSKVKQYIPWAKKSAFQNFQDVKSLTIFEGDSKGAFLDFVHNMMSAMSNVRHVLVRENQWRHTREQNSNSLNRQFWGVHTFKKGWRKGIKNLAKIETFRIKIFDRPTTLIYLQLLILAQTSLTTLEIDFSKNYGLPFESIVLEDVYKIISLLIIQSKATLENLKIKWDHRVEDDKSIQQYSQDIEPFTLFLEMLLNKLEEFKTLRLKILMLNFPSAPLFYDSVYSALIPFLKSQEASLEKFYLSRIAWDSSVSRFHARFPPKMRHAFEYGVYMGDYGRWTWWNNQLTLMKAVRSIEFECLESSIINLHSFHARRIRSSRTGNMKWAKQAMVSLKIYNSYENVDFQVVRFAAILNTFKGLQELEMIDGTGEGWQCTNQEFNLLFTKLPVLKSLKLTNLLNLTDAGLCNLPELEIKKMREAGVCFPQPDPMKVPIAQAKCLKYVELRDLSSNVTDISVYLAMQHIPKLEKIAFQGKHEITEWASRVLTRRFGRNPLFAVYFQRSRKCIKPYMIDFP